MIEGDLFGDSSASAKINIKAVLFRYLQYWYLFVIGVVLCVSAAYIRIRYTVPQYYISSNILIKDDKKGQGLAESAAFSDLNTFQFGKNIDNEIILLKSRNLVERVLTELSFHTTYYYEGRFHDLEVYGSNLPLKVIVSSLEPSAYGKTISVHTRENNSFEIEEKTSTGEAEKSSHKFGQQINKPYGVFTIVASSGNSPVKPGQKLLIQFHGIADLAGYYSEKISVYPISKNTSVLNIGLLDPVPEKGIDIVNKLIEVYEKEAVEDKNKIAANTLRFIDERMAYLTTELSDVEKNVELFKKQNNLTDVSSEASISLSGASEYSRQLAAYELQLDLLNSIENYLKKEENQFDLVPSSLSIQDPTLSSLISKFNELQLERQRMLRTTQPENPLVVNITDQLSNLRANIKENLRNIKNGMSITRQNLMANSSRFESRKRQVPEIERELLEINRQQSVKANLYLYLLQKREESALSLAATVSNSRVIDAASAGYPIGPNKPMLYTIAILIGLGVPFAGLYLKDLLNDKVQQLNDVEKMTPTPILGEIARNRKGGKTVVITKDNRSSIAEMFRHVRTNLQFATLGKENKVILITSSMSGEGKTFFSINLAASLVLTGKRVVVIGMDLRKPQLLQALELRDAPGISNYIVSNTISVNDIVMPVKDVPELYVIGSGPVPPNPAELLLSPKVEKLFHILKESFDYIIIDTAPVGQVVDAFMLAPYVDSTIYLVRYNYTNKAQIEIINKVYREKKLKHPMIVLNDAKKENGHGYGYGYGYIEDEKKKMKEV
jgi:tyrosine-protein kinase Etk/Wzc